MRRFAVSLALATAFAALVPTLVHATDTDPLDCGRTITDFGDAPEGVAFFGYVTHYPTCLAPGDPGTQELVCAPLSSPPGPTGYVRHVQDGHANYWLGCFESNVGLLYGIDSENDGTFGAGVGTPSICSQTELTDCQEFNGGGGGDECSNDGSDGSVQPSFGFAFLCGIPNSLLFSTANCSAAQTVYLNVLCDLNSDGDWNDTVPCSGGAICPCAPNTCYPEWAVKNVVITIAPGCQQHASPEFGVPFTSSPVWTRISLTSVLVDNDYPWAGSANTQSGSFIGGETEDYLFAVSGPDPVDRSTWGGVKIRYR